RLPPPGAAEEGFRGNAHHARRGEPAGKTPHSVLQSLSEFHGRGFRKTQTSPPSQRFSCRLTISSPTAAARTWSAASVKRNRCSTSSKRSNRLPKGGA